MGQVIIWLWNPLSQLSSHGPAPHVMCMVATRGSSKIMNVIFFLHALPAPMWQQSSVQRRGCLQAPLHFARSPRGQISLYARCHPIYPLNVGSIEKT